MSKQADTKNAITQAPEQKTLKQLIEKNLSELGKALPEHLRPERIVRIALTAIATNPELAKCTPASFMGSLFMAAQIGIEPIGGRAYLIPFNNSKKVDGAWFKSLECQFVIGYKGLIELFYRHDSSLSIDMHKVYFNDQLEYQYGTNAFLNHRPAVKDRGEVIGFYAVAKLKHGASVFLYMSKEDCMAHAQEHSKTWVTTKWEDGKKVNCDPHFDPKSPWATDPDSMSLKTVIIQLAKVLPLSVELQRAISVDETSRDYREGVVDAFELKDKTNWEEKGGKTIDAPAASEGNEFVKLKAKLGKENYYKILGSYGVEHSTELVAGDQKDNCLKEMQEANNANANT